MSHVGRQNLLQELDGAQAQYFFKGIRRLSALANPLAGSTPEDRDNRRSPKKLLKSYPREYRGKPLVADIRTLDPEVWHRDWNLKRRHELEFEYGRFLTRKQVQRLL